MVKKERKRDSEREGKEKREKGVGCERKEGGGIAGDDGGNYRRKGEPWGRNKEEREGDKGDELNWPCVRA